ncbi:E3 ubiquitin-protein ligase ubr1, partial [Globisporangium splendens]
MHRSHPLYALPRAPAAKNRAVIALIQSPAQLYVRSLRKLASNHVSMPHCVHRGDPWHRESVFHTGRVGGAFALHLAYEDGHVTVACISEQGLIVLRTVAEKAKVARRSHEDPRCGGANGYSTTVERERGTVAMVTLRGKKTNAKAKSSAEKPAAAIAQQHAAVGSTKAKTVANANATNAASLSTQQVQAQELRKRCEEEEQQRLLREKEERVLQLLRFTAHSALTLQKIPREYTVTSFCNTLLTALCGSGKDKKATPLQVMEKLTRNVRKRVCGAIFTCDEIAYSCRNCQVDSTCVICQDCFAHSDHTGHDVYFQRTTAGSSCDCGDPHAWKRDSFCSKHPGLDEADVGVPKKHKLPKNIGQAAPVVIDAVVDHLFQVVLGVKYGFELAEAMEVFSRDIPPQIMTEISEFDMRQAVTGASFSSGARVASRSSNTSAARRVRGRRVTRHREAQESKRDDEVAENATAAEPPFAQFCVRLHNDDVHTLTEVINHIGDAMDTSKANARAIVNEADKSGDAAVTSRDLLKCISVVGNLVRSSLNVSVAPTWWQRHMDSVADTLGWLFSISCASDGLNELVSEALCKERSPLMKGFDAFSQELVGENGIGDFFKEHNARLNGSALELFETFVGDRRVADWAQGLESDQKKMFSFRPKAEDETPTVVRNANGDLVRCENVFIEDFLKSVALSRAYSRHQSVRDGVDTVVAKFFSVPEEAKPLSALTLLIQSDCILRKQTVKSSHLLLREHMLGSQFRTEMLESYVRSYKEMTTNFLRGLGNTSDTIFDFAVQFLTVPHLVKNYTREMTRLHPERPHLLRELLSSLELVFKSAVNPKTGVLNVEHPALGNQKYKHCVDNMEYVLNIGAIPNELVCDMDNLTVWLACLQILQNGDLQARRGIHQGHVEYESDSWLSMFNLGIRVHSVFPVAWNGFQPEELRARKLQLVDVFRLMTDSLIKRSTKLNEDVEKKKLASLASLVESSESSVDVNQKSVLAYDFNVGSQPGSLHIPLHRFLAASVRHICIHQPGFADMISSEGLLNVFGFDSLSLEHRLELIEMPLRCLVMASQIHSNLWRRNGDENMLAQLYNYSALPYCIHYRDADVFMLQLGVVLMGPDSILALMLNQFQLGGYFVRPAQESDGARLSPKEFDVAHKLGYLLLADGIDEPQMLLMLEEFLRLVIILGTSLPSSTGVAHENEFLVEEMLQQLCAKSYSFSKLFDLAILPSGQDDLSITRLEGILDKVSDFIPPSGLESGRYELKEGYLEKYNPYFLHLNREAHELARDKWTSYRKQRAQKKKAKGAKDSVPVEPLKPAATPMQFLRPVQQILTCDGAIAIVQVILWKVLRADGVSFSSSSTSVNAVSDAVISTCLHLLVHGIHTAISLSSNQFWSRLCALNPTFDNLSVLHLLSKIHKKRATILDEEQAGTIEWLVWKIKESSDSCRQFLNEIEAEATRGSARATTAAAGNSAAPAAMTLEQRKEEARKRALAAMAKQQAAFQAMMSNMDDNDESEEKEADSPRIESTSDDDESSDIVQLGKRRASIEADEELKKRQKTAEEACHKCILCHDTSTQGEMGIAAYVHQSTVLATAFRPEAHEALRPAGGKVRSQVKKLIEKMELCSGGPNAFNSLDMSPPMRGHSHGFPEWYLDDSLALDSPAPQQRQERARAIGHFPMLDGELLQTDEELEVLQNVFNLRDDQQLFPMDVRRAITLELQNGQGGGGTQPRGHVHHHHGEGRRGHVHHHHALTDDSDDEGEEFTPGFHTAYSPPGISSANRESAKLYLTPCGLHIRTCQHAVHVHCLERYITSLHDKAVRGEEFDGVQAIDPDSAMTQFLCPLCKTLCNFLIPTSDPSITDGTASDDMTDDATMDELQKVSSWYSVVEEQMKISGWYRAVLGRDGDFNEDNDSAHDLWRDYFEETLWEPHGSLEKGAPFLWSACAYSLASFLMVAEDEYRNVSGGATPFDPLVDQCPSSLEKELASLSAVTKFCRWSFSLLEHSADAKVIWETSKRCCPINSETKREYRKFTKVLGSIDACLRGTILGLLVADTFTAFVVSSVIAADTMTIWRFIPVFSVADFLQRLYAEFFYVDKTEDTSLFQDKFSIAADSKSNERETEGSDAAISDVSRTRSGKAISGISQSKSHSPDGASPVAVVQDLMNTLKDAGEENSEGYAVLLLLLRMIAADTSERLKPLSRSELIARLNRVKTANAVFVRRMKLFWRCLTDQEPFAVRYGEMEIPDITEIANTSDAVLDQVWKWCVDRMNSKNFLGVAKTGDKCEHTDGASEAYVASMFILHDSPTKPRLIDLPIQYDELYSEMAGVKCERCERVPCDPGICLICGLYLCCGDSCCTRPFMDHGPPVGECTRHAAECGGGVGIVLLLDQCRVAIIGGSMAAYFPSPYVDAHGEEDIGLQRGRPLRLDMARYRYLESLWLNHRIFTEVSRQRNQREPQYAINLSYL